MKILHVYRTYFPDRPGGVEEAIRQICIATAGFGCESTVFTLSTNPNPEEVERSEALVVRERSWVAPASCDLGGLAAFQHFASLLKTADVVVYHFPWPFADLLHAWVRPKIPSVMLYHSDVIRQRWLGKAYAPLMRRTLASMSAVIATSPTYAKTSAVLSKLSVREKVQVIPLGIDDDVSKQNEDKNIFERLGICADEPFILFVGVLRYYKGLHTLVSAAATVKARIVIAGSGPEWDRLHAQVKTENINNVVFAGQVTDSEKNALFRRCSVFVLPSHLRSEAYGMVLVEAALFGRPMISCEIGSGTSYVNRHEETGMVVPPEDPAALANAINRILLEPDLAELYGQGARRRYERLFSKTALGLAYSNLFKQLIG